MSPPNLVNYLLKMSPYRSFLGWLFSPHIKNDFSFREGEKSDEPEARNPKQGAQPRVKGGKIF